jgi:hypothetical protein
MKHWAVMAMKDGWSKPRFVWHFSGELMVYPQRKRADIQAKLMKERGDTFAPAENEKLKTFVDWIVVAVWTETML